MKKSKVRILKRVLTVLLIVIGVWFAWEWRQQAIPKQTLGVQTNPKQELLSRCLDKAQKDYDRDILDSRASPSPNLTQIAAETFEIEKQICHNIYRK